MFYEKYIKYKKKYLIIKGGALNSLSDQQSKPINISGTLKPREPLKLNDVDIKIENTFGGSTYAHAHHSINEVNFKMNGGLQGNSNPIMKKVNMLPPGQIVGQNDIEHFSQNQTFSDERNSSCFPKEQLTAEELLPQDNSSLWAQVNPSGEGSLKDRNFLQSGYHIGINTVGQTLRNANLQLRSEPPCPQVKVSPWLQATIEPDLGRKPFEIGGCA
jgi:hypothetical protein